ncbi:hypothetical protein Vadar_021120 [Vaccinium darrowii]|uniref:Uncharacterized protein n=1 Tax=Vaccinium darrowii TaxID=229202 RepID=A0ACB7Y7Y6_9ERIC|nr:hypothetical protein Vadar_021120 [Vaccinium darrowii]
MDKICHSSADTSTTTTSITTATATSNNNNTDQYLRHLNKISHKISKPTTRPPTSNHHPPPPPPQLPPPPPPPPQQQQQQQQHQPPVYNIKKSDFRDVVQKLTGSPAHERFSTPPPIQPPKPQSSRLQRIRPPPLAQLSHRPPPLLSNAVPVVNPNNNNPLLNTSGQRHTAPLSPLPPFPSVHAAAESPISAYMRYLQNTVSPLTATTQQPPLAPPPQHVGQPAFLFPSSPLPFGCFPSPRSPYPLLSPSLLFSPSTAGQFGFQPFPVSPRMPTTSPRWKDL